MIPIIASFIGISVAMTIIMLIRKDRLHVTHGLVWLLAAVMMAGLGFAPALFDKLASYLGVAYPPALAFSFAFAVVIIKLLLDDIDRSRVKMRQVRLIQRIALLESEVRRANRAKNVAEKTAEAKSSH